MSVIPRPVDLSTLAVATGQPSGKIPQTDGADGFSFIDTPSGAGFTYSAYTPTLTATTTNPTLGSGATQTGRYFQSGDWVHVEGLIRFGSSGTNAGSGVYLVSLPVAADTSITVKLVGHGTIRDDSSAAHHTVAYQLSTSTSALIRYTATVNNSSPWGWAANDWIWFTFDYEAA